MKFFKRIKEKVSLIPLSRKIWMYFMLFTVIVFVLLWFSQIFFLEHFYESMKVSDVAQASESLEKAYDELEVKEFYEYVSETAVDNDLCIEILDRYGRSIYSCEVLGDCIIHGRGNSISTFWQRLKSSSDGVIYYKVKNPRSNYDMLVYGCEIGGNEYPDGYLLVNSALVPVGSTASIIKRQLKIITAILIVVAFVISLYVSKRIARPITKITESAKGLAKGNFDTEFSGEGYLEVKQLADTLNYAERELLKVDTMQRDLIANISHDLRTPLTMVKAYAELIRDLSGDKPEKRKEHLEIIIDETDRLALLVNDVLDLSKLESGKEHLTFSEIDIKEELEEIIGRYKGVSEKRGYHIHLSSDESRMVKCDILKIEQVIYNLINNAINYTGEDRNVYVRQINLEDEVLIEIEDTGDGIEEDKIKLIFDKYYRSENHKREVIGTGLGLSIVKAVLKLHNFDYGVRSTKGKGSVFWFKIRCEHDNVQNV